MTPADEWARGNQQEREEDRRAEDQAEPDAPDKFVTCVCRDNQHRAIDWWGSLVPIEWKTDGNRDRARKFHGGWTHVVKFEMTVVG